MNRRVPRGRILHSGESLTCRERSVSGEAGPSVVTATAKLRKIFGAALRRRMRRCGACAAERATAGAQSADDAPGEPIVKWAEAREWEQSPSPAVAIKQPREAGTRVLFHSKGHVR